MSELSDLWRIDSFRQAVGTFLALDETAVAALRERNPAEPGPPSPDLSIDPAAWTESAAVLRTLYTLAARIGAESVVNELAELRGVRVDSNPRIQGLLTWLQPRREDIEAQAIDRAMVTMLPVLTTAAAVVDFRLTDLVNEGGLRLVPVLIVRLSFDEHVAGSDGIVFQLSPADLDRLIDELKAARRKADSLAAQLPTDLLLGESFLKGGQPDGT